jgi:hypothetical protein
MKLTKIILLSGILLFVSCKTATKTITIKNDLDIDRSFETIKITKSDLKLREEDNLYDYVIQDKDGVWQVTQYEDRSGDGSVDYMLFQPKVTANSFTNYTIVHIPNAELPEREEICFSRFVPERTDDYAWENDKVAFRVFGPTAQKMFEDGIEGGTLSSGIDCWLKRVDYPIINKWYKKNTEKTGSYHEDTGEGLDSFHVGVSRGCGGIAIKKDSTYYISKNFINYKTLMTGPIRTSFYLEYKDWDANGTLIKESRIITLDLGNNLSKFEVTIEGTSEISAGLTLHEGNGKISENIKNSWLSHWEPHGDSELGTAIVTYPESLNGFEKYKTNKKDLSNAYLHLKLDNNKVVYYAGFGWKKRNNFKNSVAWNTYLNEFSMKLQSPLEIIIK